MVATKFSFHFHNLSSCRFSQKLVFHYLRPIKWFKAHKLKKLGSDLKPKPIHAVHNLVVSFTLGPYSQSFLSLSPLRLSLSLSLSLSASVTRATMQALARRLGHQSLGPSPSISSLKSIYPLHDSCNLSFPLSL